MLLAGDIGGTKTDLAIFTAEKGPRSPLAQGRFRSANYTGLEVMVQEFLARVNLSINQACFAVAGPVINGRAQLTNLPWVAEETALRKILNVDAVRLLNDLEAIANAVPQLLANDVHTLSAGVPAPGGAIGVIAPGTGLGEAYLTWDGAAYRAHPSEGGHADFAPSTPAEIELLRYLQQRLGHVSYERVCSGSGIPNLYDFLRDSGVAAASPEMAARLALAQDRTPLILQAGLDPHGTCPLCAATVRLFISILGAEAGNLALKLLATGGVYIGGGIPPRILPALTNARFLEAFRHKGRLTELLVRVPVHVILHPVALLGAASYGLRQAAA